MALETGSIVVIKSENKNVSAEDFSLSECIFFITFLLYVLLHVLSTLPDTACVVVG